MSTLATITALEQLVFDIMGSHANEDVKTDITLAGTLLSSMVTLIVPRLAPSLPLEKIDEALSQIILSLETLRHVMTDKTAMLSHDHGSSGAISS